MPKKCAKQPRYWSEARLFPHPEVPAAVNRQRDHHSTIPHRHEFIELVLILGGTGIHETAGGRQTLVPGDWFVLIPTQTHAYRKTRRLDLVNVFIRDRAFHRLFPILRTMKGFPRLWRDLQKPFQPLRPLLPDERESLLHLILRMERELAHREEGYPQLLFSLLTELLITACRLAAQPAGESAHRSRIGRLITHLDQQFTEPLSLSQMEALTGLSPRSLQRHFLSVTGCSPHQYLLRRRMAHACRLLRETDCKIAGIAAQTGFSDVAYFARMFRRLTGETARGYRRRLAFEPRPE